MKDNVSTLALKSLNAEKTVLTFDSELKEVWAWALQLVSFTELKGLDRTKAQREKQLWYLWVGSHRDAIIWCLGFVFHFEKWGELFSKLPQAEDHGYESTAKTIHSCFYAVNAPRHTRLSCTTDLHLLLLLKSIAGGDNMTSQRVLIFCSLQFKILPSGKKTLKPNMTERVSQESCTLWQVMHLHLESFENAGFLYLWV